MLKKVFLLFLIGHVATAQEHEHSKITHNPERIAIDGILSEKVWATVPSFNTFLRNFPDNDSTARYDTEVWITYNEENLYVAAKMYRDPSSTYAIASLQRDFTVLDNDAFGIIIDPFLDKTNGYGFYVNAGGAWRDEQISQGTIANATWDTKWRAEIQRTPHYWTVEFEIPFKYFRNKGGTEWNLNFVRTDKGANERTSLHRVPINFMLHNLAFTQSLVWGDGIAEQKKKVSLIPSLTLSGAKHSGEKISKGIQPSLDAKIALSSSVNLDLTINPDFSQTSADIFQLNLTRFELVYPENRLFFIENSDLFAGFGDESWGNPVLRPFYSRRIGLKYDHFIGGYVPSQIIAGARVSGKLNNNYRFGAMTVFTEQETNTQNDTAVYTPSQNYTVAAAQYKLFSRSYASVMFANRQAFGAEGSREFALNRNDFNRVTAVEYNFASPNDKVSGKIYHHFEFKNDKPNPEFSRGVLINHNSKRWRNWFHLTEVSKHYNPEIGLVSRNDLKDINIHLGYSMYPKKGIINQVELVANQHNYWNNRGEFTDYFNISGIHTIMKTTHEFWLVYIRERNTLREPFDPSFRNIQPFETGYVGEFGYARTNYSTDTRKPFYMQVDANYGRYYLGTQSLVNGVIRYRPHYFVNLSIAGTWVQYRMPAPYNVTDIVYVGPKLDLNFTRNLSWTSLVQYNSLYHRLTVYSRLQWRFMPLSDFFIIYSNNSDTQQHTYEQNINIKMSLWI